LNPTKTRGKDEKTQTQAGENGPGRGKKFIPTEKGKTKWAVLGQGIRNWKNAAGPGNLGGKKASYRGKRQMDEGRGNLRKMETAFTDIKPWGPQNRSKEGVARDRRRKGREGLGKKKEKGTKQDKGGENGAQGKKPTSPGQREWGGGVLPTEKSPEGKTPEKEK